VVVTRSYAHRTSGQPAVWTSAGPANLLVGWSRSVGRVTSVICPPRRRSRGAADVRATAHPSIGAAVLCTLSGMQGGEVIQRARRWSGLSQVELGDRLGVPASTVAAWEASDPDFSLVERVVRASGHELHRVVAEADPDPHDLALIDANLLLTVDERFERLAAHVRFIEAGRAALRAAR
jgi:transcriptional regulator with XRE-family HTH domain